MLYCVRSRENIFLSLRALLGVSVWKLLEEGKEEGEIISSLMQEYEVDEETLTADVKDFLQSLREKELLLD